MADSRLYDSITIVLLATLALCSAVPFLLILFDRLSEIDFSWPKTLAASEDFDQTEKLLPWIYTAEEQARFSAAAQCPACSLIAAHDFTVWPSKDDSLWSKTKTGTLPIVERQCVNPHCHCVWLQR